MKMRMTCLALLLCLLLTACGGKEPDSQGRTSLLGEAAGLEEEEVLMTVDGREVPAWRYLYWLAFTCDRVAERYREAGVVLDWQAPLDGGTLADYAKDQALADTALYATVENWAARYGCALSDQDRQAIDDDWAEMAQAHGGEADYLEELARLGLNRERAAELTGVETLYGKLCTLRDTAGSALAPTQETLEAFAAESGRLTVDRVLISAGNDREAARKKAAETFAQLNGAENQAAVFDALAKAGDDTAGPRTVLPGDGQFPSELEEAAQALAVGQCSGILESDEGFSILRRLPPETAGLAEDYFDGLLRKGAEDSVVETTAEYVGLDAARFYQALETLRGTEKAP